MTLKQLIKKTINKLNQHGIELNENQLKDINDNYELEIPITEKLLENYVVTDYKFSTFYRPQELHNELLSSTLVITPEDIQLNSKIKSINEDELPYLNEDLNLIKNELKSILSTFNYEIERFLIEKKLVTDTINKNDLKNLKDKPGDKFDIDFEINVATRNQAFVYIDGKIAIGNDHSKLTEELLGNKYDAGRIDSYNLDVPVAFGHIIDKFAFIEYVQNVDKQTVAKDIVVNENIEKVYDYSNTHKTITRLAKSIYNSNELCYNIYKKANAPGNDLISKQTAEDLIKANNPDLLDKTKWQRFVMTGDGQGVVGIYGYFKGIDKIHYYYVELHSFQTAGKLTKETQYMNLYLDCEVDENNNIIGNINLKSGTNEFPKYAADALNKEYNIDENTKITMVGRTLEQTINESLQIERQE